MNDFDVVSILPMLFVALVALIVLLIILSKILVNVGAREIAIKERRYFGAKMPPGRVVATEGEVGIQADVLKPGLHVIRYPFERVERKVPLIEIGADELGVIEAIDGEPMPPGKSFAPDRAQNAHNNFQDPIAFIKQGGVKGFSCALCLRGCGRFILICFRVSVAKTTMIRKAKSALSWRPTAGRWIPDVSSVKQSPAISVLKRGALCFDRRTARTTGGILTPGTYRI